MCKTVPHHNHVGKGTGHSQAAIVDGIIEHNHRAVLMPGTYLRHARIRGLQVTTKWAMDGYFAYSLLEDGHTLGRITGAGK